MNETEAVSIFKSLTGIASMAVIPAATTPDIPVGAMARTLTAPPDGTPAEWQAWVPTVIQNTVTGTDMVVNHSMVYEGGAWRMTGDRATRRFGGRRKWVHVSLPTEMEITATVEMRALGTGPAGSSGWATAYLAFTTDSQGSAIGEGIGARYEPATQEWVIGQINVGIYPHFTGGISGASGSWVNTAEGGLTMSGTLYRGFQNATSVALRFKKAAGVVTLHANDVLVYTGSPWGDMAPNNSMSRGRAWAAMGLIQPHEDWGVITCTPPEVTLPQTAIGEGPVGERMPSPTPGYWASTSGTVAGMAQWRTTSDGWVTHSGANGLGGLAIALDGGARMAHPQKLWAKAHVRLVGGTANTALRFMLGADGGSGRAIGVALTYSPSTDAWTLVQGQHSTGFFNPHSSMVAGSNMSMNWVTQAAPFLDGRREVDAMIKVDGTVLSFYLDGKFIASGDAGYMFPTQSENQWMAAIIGTNLGGTYGTMEVKHLSAGLGDGPNDGPGAGSAIEVAGAHAVALGGAASMQSLPPAPAGGQVGVAAQGNVGFYSGFGSLHVTPFSPVSLSASAVVGAITAVGSVQCKFFMSGVWNQRFYGTASMYSQPRLPEQAILLAQNWSASLYGRASLEVHREWVQEITLPPATSLVNMQRISTYWHVTNQ